MFCGVAAAAAIKFSDVRAFAPITLKDSTAGFSDQVNAEGRAIHRPSMSKGMLLIVDANLQSEATAEDILQAAYLKAIERGSEIRNGESTVAWFYRILRNAIVDHYRRLASRDAAHEAFAAEMIVRHQFAKGDGLSAN